AERGIRFQAEENLAMVTLGSPEEVTEYCADRIAFFAKRCGVSVEHYNLFRDWKVTEHMQCRGTAKDGSRCANKVYDSYDIRSFKPGFSDMCECHRPEYRK
ncbi:MAG: hypothetical protein JZU63_13570, partial [Rhodoferax sp.]|nr:hypothetical protein [Rhodoferax sp.]